MALFDDVRRKVLDNGIEILVREDHASRVAALHFFVRVGSLNEDDAIAGWSHGIEHMLFKGTSRRGPGDIAREIQDLGGETNAGTGYESTSYHIVLPSENAASAIDIHADVLLHSTFDAGELEKEREVLIQENAMYRDRPTGYGFTWEGLLAEAFTTHRYQRPIGGPDENLLQVGRDHIVAFKDAYYVPNNVTYVVVGDVNAEAVLSLLEKKLGAWPRGLLAPDRSPMEPPQSAFRFRRTVGDVERAYLKIGFHVPPELDPDTDALLVAAHILGSGRASRLYRRVREEKGLILNSSILETTGKEPGYLVVEVSTETEKAEPALEAVMGEILRFREEPVTREEIERTLRAVQTDTLSALETMEGQASMLGHYALLGDHRLAGTYLERLAGVTAERILDAGRRHFRLEKATIYAHVPKEHAALSFPGGAPEVAARLRRNAMPVFETVAVPAEGAAPAPPPVASGRPRAVVEAVTLAGGTRAILQVDGSLPLVSLAAYFPVGSGSEDAGRAGLTRLTQLCMMKGAGGRSAAEIADALEGMGARLHPFTSRDVSGFSLNAVREDLPRAFAILEDVLSKPAFSEEAVEREKDRTLAQIQAIRDDTVRFTVADLYRRLFPDHAYGRPVEGSEEAVGRLAPSALREWHARVHDPARMVVGVVGDFDREDMLLRLEGLTRALSGHGGAPPTPKVVRAAETGRRELSKEVSQAVVVVGWPGPALDAPERYALEVWNNVLSGMGNRLFTSLRDERHLCYFTGSFASLLREGGVIGAYVGTSPERIEEALDALLEELRRSTREHPSETEMTRAKNTIAGSQLVDLQTRMAWAASYARDEVLGLGYEETLRSMEAIRAVRREAVTEAAARYLAASSVAIAVLRPEDPVPEAMS